MAKKADSRSYDLPRIPPATVRVSIVDPGSRLAKAVDTLAANGSTEKRAAQIPVATAVALDRLARTALSAIEARQLEEATRELAERRAQQPTAARRRK